MTDDSQYGNIPEDLRRLRQWVNWRNVKRKGKPTKVPMQPGGVPASTTDPKTWNTFERVAPLNRLFNGIGFVFTMEAGYVGIDLDKCRNPKTGVTEEWALTFIEELDSYTEISPSGTGWHVIVKGSLPGDGKKRGPVEMYDSKRFFCMTGALVPGVGRGTIEARVLSFRQMKDPRVVSFSPMFHWTEHNIRVHTFTCVLAPQIAHLLRLQAERAGLHMSVRELLRQLAGIGETVLIYPAERGRPKARRILTETTAAQDKLIQVFQLNRNAPSVRS